MHAGDVTFSIEADLGKLKRDLDNAFKNIQSFAGKAEGTLSLQSGMKFDGSKLNKELKQQVNNVGRDVIISPKLDTKKLNSIKNELNSIQIKQNAPGPTGPMGGEKGLLNDIKKINDLLAGKSESISKVKDAQTREALQEPFSKEKIGKLIGMALSEHLEGLKAKLPADPKLLSDNKKEAIKLINEPISIDSIKRIAELAVRDEISKFKPQINPNSDIPLSTQKDAIQIINQPMSFEKIKQMVELALKDQMRTFEENKPILPPKVNIPAPDPINIPTPKIETGRQLDAQLDAIEKTMQLQPIAPEIDLKNIKAELDTLKEIKINSQVNIEPIAPIKIPNPIIEPVILPDVNIPQNIQEIEIPDLPQLNIPQDIKVTPVVEQAKISIPEPKINIPKITPINLEAPRINIPQIEQSIIDLPYPKVNIFAPDPINIPTPKIEIPQLNIPQDIKITPVVEQSKVNIPEINLQLPTTEAVQNIKVMPIINQQAIPLIENPKIELPDVNIPQNIQVLPKIDISQVSIPPIAPIKIPAPNLLVEKIPQPIIDIPEPKINIPPANLINLEAPKIDIPKLEQITIDLPYPKVNIFAPDPVKIPEPKIELPQVNIPQDIKIVPQIENQVIPPIETPKIKLPDVMVPQNIFIDPVVMPMPKINIPQIELPQLPQLNILQGISVMPQIDQQAIIIPEPKINLPQLTPISLNPKVISQVEKPIINIPEPKINLPKVDPINIIPKINPPGPSGPGPSGPAPQAPPKLRDIDVIGIRKKWNPIEDIQKLLGLKKEVEKETVKIKKTTGENIINLVDDFEGGAKKLGELLKESPKPKLLSAPKLLSGEKIPGENLPKVPVPTNKETKLLSDHKLLSGEKNIEKKISLTIDENKKKQAIDAVKNIKIDPPKVDISPTKEAVGKINSSIEQSSGKLEDTILKTQKNTADSRKKTIEDLFKVERDLAIENILNAEAQKIDSLKRIANQNDLLGDENKRQQSLQGISAEVNLIMPLEKAKSDLEYKLQIASLNENEVGAEQLKQQIFQQNLKITEAKYRADSEALNLQIEGKNIALETAKIQAQIALTETEANLNRAFANGEKARTITALRTELEYRQKLVESATANISNTQKINELEKKKLLLNSQSTKEALKQSREIEKLKQAKDKANKDSRVEKQATNSMLKSPKVRLIEQEQLSLDLVKKRFDIATKYLEAVKDIGDRSIDMFETTTNPQLVLDILKKQYQLQEKINKSKLDAIQEEIKLNLHNLEIERAKDISSFNRNEAESRQEILRAKQTILRAERSGDQISIEGAKNELRIANENLSVVLQEREYADQIYIHKKQQLAIEGKSNILQEKMSQRAGLIASYQQKINSAGKTFNNILEQQQKQLQSIGDLNKTIFDARVNALSQESGLLDNAIELRNRLDSDEEKPKTLTDEMNKQLRAISGSSGVSEKKLLMDRLKLEERMAKEKMLALKAEQSIQKSLLEIELNKQRIQAQMAVMQAKLMAMSLKGTAMEGGGKGLIRDAVKNQINVENLAKNALDSLGIKQAMELYNQGLDNFRNINQQRLNVAEKGYVPQGELPQLPKLYDVPKLKQEPQYQPPRIQDTLLKDVVNLIGQKRDESLLSNIESIASQILDKLDVLPQGTTNKPDTNNLPSMASSGSSNNTNLPTPPVVNNNYGGLTFISSDPTGDARKVLNDLAKANKNK